LFAVLYGGLLVGSFCITVSPLILPGISPRCWTGWGKHLFRSASSTKQEVIWLRMANIELIIDSKIYIKSSPLRLLYEAGFRAGKRGGESGSTQLLQALLPIGLHV